VSAAPLLRSNCTLSPTLTHALTPPRFDLALAGLEEVKRRWEHSPELGRAWLLQIEILLSPDRLDLDAAKAAAEALALSHHSGSFKLPVDLARAFFALLWNQAALFHAVG
jgi:hypothetical protein